MPERDAPGLTAPGLTAPDDDERGTGRLEAFSDGVIAIAITLLVLNLAVPTATQLSAGLAQLGLAFVGYATSFLIVGIYWANHHAIFRYIQRTTHLFLLINLFFLMLISFMPFATAVYARYIVRHGQGESATLFYGGTLVVTALLFNALWLYAVWARLLTPGLPASLIGQVTRGYLIGPAFYVVATLLSLVSVWVSLTLYFAIPLLYVIPVERLQRRLARRTRP